MNDYLNRYIGTYRVKAEYDWDTHDFPRDSEGNVDDSFGDFYIACYNDIQIKHIYNSSNLSCYIPSIKRGKTILREILSDECKKQIKSDKQIKNAFEKSNILIDYEITDGEVYIDFKAKDIEYISKFVKIKTSGANIRPLSSKNLPKLNSILPQDKADEYNITLDSFNLEPIDKAKVVKNVNSLISKKLPKNYNTEMRRELIDFKSYIYKNGLWNEYIELIKKELS